MNRHARRRAAAIERKQTGYGHTLSGVSLASLSSSPVLFADDRVTMCGVTIVGPGIGPAVREVLSNEIKRVLAEHGLAAFENPKWATCLHEGGHAITTPWLGKSVTKVTITECASKNWIGWTHCADDAWHVNFDDKESAAQTLIAIARNLYAGIAAEGLFAGDDRREGSSIDEVVISQLAAQTAAVTCEVDGETLWRRAVHIPVCRHLQRNAHVVRRIAGHLLEHHEIEGSALQLALSEVKS
jgi:hypothetical protein